MERNELLMISARAHNDDKSAVNAFRFIHYLSYKLL